MTELHIDGICRFVYILCGIVSNVLMFDLRLFVIHICTTQSKKKIIHVECAANILFKKIHLRKSEIEVKD